MYLQVFEYRHFRFREVKIFNRILVDVVKLKFCRNLALDKEFKNKFQEYFSQK